jgi:uncharacterized protein (UPF0147 family)
MFEELLQNPPLWLQTVEDELDNIIINIDKLKAKQIKTQINELDTLVSQISNAVEIPDNIRQFFHDNKTRILELGDKDFIESAKTLNLIEVEEEDKKQKESKELEEKLAKLKSGVGA